MVRCCKKLGHLAGHIVLFAENYRNSISPLAVIILRVYFMRNQARVLPKVKRMGGTLKVVSENLALVWQIQNLKPPRSHHSFLLLLLPPHMHMLIPIRGRAGGLILVQEQSRSGRQPGLIIWVCASGS